MNFFQKYSICFTLLLLLISFPAKSQLFPTGKPQEEEPETPKWPEDSLSRRTPRSTISGYIDAIADQNYKRASYYLDLSKVKDPKETGFMYAQGLQQLVNKQGHIRTVGILSDDPKGEEEEELGKEFERVGSATVDDERFPLILERIEHPELGPIWLFSSATVEKIPLVKLETNRFNINNYLPPALKEKKWLGAPVGHWLYMLALIFVCYFVASGFMLILQAFIRLFMGHEKYDHYLKVIAAIALPIKLYIALILLVKVAQRTGVSIILRQKFGLIISAIVVVLFLLLVWRIVVSITRIGEKRMLQQKRLGVVSAIIFLRRSALFLIMVFGAITILNIFGIDVTTGLAALGIGGLALALGAQKAIENFVGSVTLIADQPIRVGDFCKIGDTVGTVEQIGMRSTVIRTLARTLVVIPNGQLSSMNIENFAFRDFFLLNPTLGLRYETTPEQIRYLLVELRSLLYAHPKVTPEPARVRFVELGSDSLKLEVFAYVKAVDINDFLEVQEDLILRMMDIVDKSGSGFAFPSQTIYFGKDSGLSEERSKEAEEQVRQWREKGELQIPHFDEKQINKLKESIKYPAEGSSSSKGKK